MADFDLDYVAVRGSDLNRDGMYLEVQRQDDRRAVIEVFYSDVDGAMTFTAMQGGLPHGLVEWAIREAKRLLPPVSDSDKPEAAS